MAGERVKVGVQVEATGQIPKGFKWMGKHTRVVCRRVVAAVKARVKAGLDATLQPFGEAQDGTPITMKRSGKMLKDLGIQKATAKFGHVGPRKLRYGFVQNARFRWVGFTTQFEIPAVDEEVAAQVKAIVSGEGAKKATRGKRSAVP